MARDLIYTFDKATFLRTTFGEIQSGFNMSATIDGTRDSMKVNVWSFNKNEILPNTIVYHENTQTWWIASSDKVERHANENGFIYLHNLELVGAIELLNARDLTDSGFNDKRYNFEDFILRLFKLSNFEFKDNITIDYEIANKQVEYIKTFENYTLLSALREFLDGYNLSAELSFLVTTIGIENPRYHIYGATLKLIQRTGNYNLAKHNIDEFDDVRETKNISKDSYGACVVSNAENVVSSIAKTYPNLGTIKPSGTEYNILAQNAIIRLPSNVFKANWLKLCLKVPPLKVKIHIGTKDTTLTNGELLLGSFTLNPYNYKTYLTSFNWIDTIVSRDAQEQGATNFYLNYIAARTRQDAAILDFFKKAATMTLYNGNEVNPVDSSIVKGENVPYIPNVTYNAKFINALHPTLPLIFCDKEMRDMLERPWQAIYWERGKNTISGFNGFETEQGNTQGSIVGFNPNNCDLQGQTEFTIYQDGNGNYVKIIHEGNSTTLHFRDTQWIVNYVPMSDIKLKVDNDRKNNDIQLYNQNGKLTDGVALSKLINSYAKEISSDSITRYKSYYNFLDIPELGSIVINGEENYVINNISYDFMQNEDDGYYIECEITMSKYTTLKSMMVNPNTNIRDYGIPQNNNVKRKQLYRDYFELDYEPNSENDYYLNPERYLNFNNSEPLQYTAVMKLHYSREINNSYYWYYQLDSLIYYMNKLIVVMLDFNDNNIIGYTNQNVWSGFDITRVFSGQIDSLNTPISYVDSKGEFSDIVVCFESNEQLTDIYYNYQLSQTGGDTYTGTLYNYSPFIPEEIFNGAYSNHDIKIEEIGYDKDALEVPVFEYCCQAGDNKNVLFGDNVLMKRENNIVFYSFYTDNDLTAETATTNLHLSRSGDVLSLNNVANIQYQVALPSPAIEHNHLRITLSSSMNYDLEDSVYNEGTRLNIPSDGIDIAIFRHSYNLDTGEEIVELAFICKNVTSEKLYNQQTLILYINSQKLK